MFSSSHHLNNEFLRPQSWPWALLDSHTTDIARRITITPVFTPTIFVARVLPDTNTNTYTYIYLYKCKRKYVYTRREAAGVIHDWGWPLQLGRDHSRKSLLKANLIHLLFNFKAQIPSAFSFNLNAKLIYFDFNSKADNPVQIQFLELKHRPFSFRYHSTMSKASLTHFVKVKMHEYRNTW